MTAFDDDRARDRKRWRYRFWYRVARIRIWWERVG